MKELRGHHVFCTFLFSGSGYDESFTENMQKVIDGMKAGEPFILRQGHDSICAACPNRTPDGCALGTEDVARRDQAALSELGLAPGQELGWGRMKELLGQLDEPAFQRVCGNCRWQQEGLCSFRLLQKRAED